MSPPRPVPRAIDARTRIIALVGDPVDHSKTPVIQNAALEALGLNVINVAFCVSAQHFPLLVAGARVAGLLGLMVTIPHKLAALAIAEEKDPLATRLGAANLLHFQPDGKTKAYNTDAYGALQSLRDAGIEPRGTSFLILGTGGAGRCLAIALAMAGAARVVLCNRTKQRADQVAAEIAGFGDARPEVIKWEDIAISRAACEAEVLVNATSIGMHPHSEASPIPSSALHCELTVFDIVYNPLETRLLREARAVGASTIDGVGMLVYTNERAVQICCGADPDVGLMREVCVRSLQGS